MKQTRDVTFSLLCDENNKPTTHTVKKTIRCNKRELSPTTALQSTECAPKKLKSTENEKTQNSSDVSSNPIAQSELIESKLKEPLPTPGIDTKPSNTVETPEERKDIKFLVTSGEPQPFTHNNANDPGNKITPPWAQEVLSILTGLSNEVRILRREVT